jgi:hypothetical protein
MFKPNRQVVPADAADPLLVELREQTKWLRFLGLRSLGPILEQQLKTDQEKLAYELSDGRPSRAVGDAVGVTGRSILNWWAKWTAAGIAVDQGGGRVIRLASLTQVGMSVPSMQIQPSSSAGPAAPMPPEQVGGNAE